MDDATKTLSPLARYNLATADGGWLTAPGWERLAADLDAASMDARRNIGPEDPDFVAAWEESRKLLLAANDCRFRAAGQRSAS